MKENTPILEELVELRHQQANLLGYSTHAAYIQERRMAKSPDNVTAFLSGLTEKLQKLWKKEMQELTQLKNEEVV